MPRGCSIIAMFVLLINGIIMAFGWHKGGEDLSGGGVAFIVIALLSLYVLLTK